MRRLTEDEVKRLEKAVQFVGLLRLPHKNLHQITLDFCEEIGALGFDCDEDRLSDLVYRMECAKNICRRQILDYDILCALLSILDPRKEK